MTETIHGQPILLATTPTRPVYHGELPGRLILVDMGTEFVVSRQYATPDWTPEVPASELQWQSSWANGEYFSYGANFYTTKTRDEAMRDALDFYVNKMGK